MLASPAGTQTGSALTDGVHTGDDLLGGSFTGSLRPPPQGDQSLVVWTQQKFQTRFIFTQTPASPPSTGEAIFLLLAFSLLSNRVCLCDKQTYADRKQQDLLFPFAVVPLSLLEGPTLSHVVTSHNLRSWSGYLLTGE